VFAQVCASVRIQIEQEATLERQAFDAQMTIDNGLPETTLSNVDIQINFRDEAGNPVAGTSDTNNTTALFFIQQPVLNNIDSATNGTVPAGATASIHWLIIPTLGAAGSNALGKLYYVGASLTYKAQGIDQAVDVIPDYITVEPMPNLALDYFLPGQVYGDDPFTTVIEPSVPFSLGLRIKNIGYSIASDVALDSGQPKIVANRQGLLVSFAIQSAEVNGVGTGPSLLLNYGDIEPQKAKMGRWVMTSSLSGSFTEFAADISHAGALDIGGVGIVQAAGERNDSCVNHGP